MQHDEKFKSLSEKVREISIFSQYIMKLDIYAKKQENYLMNEIIVINISYACKHYHIIQYYIYFICANTNI